MNHLGVSEHVLRRYLENGDSVLLANRFNFIHQFVDTFLEAKWTNFPLAKICQLIDPNCNVQDTPPGLQHNFCRLWNKIVPRKEEHDDFPHILRRFHNFYNDLHQELAMPGSFPLCSIPSHRADSRFDLNEDDDGGMAETAHASITTSPALHLHDPVPSVIPRAADPIQGTTDHSALSFNTGFHSTSSHGTASRPTRNMITATPSFVPDTVPSPTRPPTSGPDHAAPHVSAPRTVNESSIPPGDGSISHFSSQILTAFPLAPEVISSFNPNAATESGPLDAPVDTLDPNRHASTSQSFPRSLPDVAEYSVQSEDGDPSELGK